MWVAHQPTSLQHQNAAQEGKQDGQEKSWVVNPPVSGAAPGSWVESRGGHWASLESLGSSAIIAACLPLSTSDSGDPVVTFNSGSMNVNSTLYSSSSMPMGSLHSRRCFSFIFQ